MTKKIKRSWMNQDGSDQPYLFYLFVYFFSYSYHSFCRCNSFPLIGEQTNKQTWRRKTRNYKSTCIISILCKDVKFYKCAFEIRYGTLKYAILIFYIFNQHNHKNQIKLTIPCERKSKLWIKISKLFSFSI